MLKNVSTQWLECSGVTNDKEDKDTQIMKLFNCRGWIHFFRSSGDSELPVHLRVDGICYDCFLSSYIS